jgi:hypothetical protein
MSLAIAMSSPEGGIDWDDPKQRRDYVLRRHASMKQERQSYEPQWREISDYIAPRRGRFLVNDTNDGKKRYNNIIDNTAVRANRTLAAGMMAGITSPARPWFRLATPDPQLMEFGPVRRYLHFVERLMREVFNQSNFYNCVHSTYVELGAFCTGALILDEDFEDVIRGYPLTVGEYALGLSERMEVNALSREYRLSVWQVVARFGLERCSRHVRDLYAKGHYDQWVDCLHLIYPNPRYEEGRLGPQGFPYSSVYLEAQRAEPAGAVFLREAGYREFPVLAPRWDVRGGDIYGIGPGMEALGDAKQLQVQQRRKSQGIDKLVSPPMVAPSMLANQPSSTLPGGVTYVDAVNAQAGFRPAYQVDPKLGELRLDMADVQLRIKETFYEDLFRMVTEMDRRQITAREIDERHEEKLLMLGPVLERLHNELLDKVIDRTFAVMSRANLLPEAPRELQGQALKVEYISILAQAQRAIGVGGIERLTGYALSLAQAKPDVLDKLDFDQAIDEYAEMLGTPPDLVLADDVVEKRRAARAQAEAEAVKAQQAQMAADSAAKLGQAQLNDGSTALDRLINPL